MRAEPGRVAVPGPVGVALQAMPAGVLCAFAGAWPLDWGWERGQPLWALQLAGFVWWSGLLARCARGREALLCGGTFALAWIAASTWWLYVAMHTYGGLPSALAGAAVLLLAAALAVYYAVAMVGWQRCAAARRWWGPALLAALWTMAELARGSWLTGFGWGAAGYGQVQGPLAALAPWIGAYGMGAVIVWMAASLAQALQWRRAGPAALVALGLLALALLPRAEFTRSGGSVPVLLLQGNIPQDEKFEAGSGVPLALEWYARQWTGVAPGTLVVAPETAIPLLAADLPPGYWDALHAAFGAGPSALLVGIPTGDLRSGYANSVLGLRAGQLADYRYDKHHLVPFGEFIPPLFRWFTRMMHIPLGDFARGALGQPAFDWNGQRLAPLICYEDLFGEELGPRFADAATAPTVLVNVSNLGWFGDTVAMDQHLQISRMRALEFERPFLRATNTGATLVMDHRGQVVAQLPHLRRDVLRARVEGRSGTTPFAWWIARCGLWPYWAVALLVLAAAWRARPGTAT